jgi:HSP20 family protein
MRWDPFGEAMSLRDGMNRLFEQAVLRTGATGETASGEGRTFAPALDIHESREAYTVTASLPGVKPENVNIQYQKGVLTISGETSNETTREEGTFHVRERRQGHFSRSISLPDTVNADAAEANYNDGVLTLRMPKAEEMKARRIEVHTGSQGAPAIETSANSYAQPVGSNN